MIWHGRPFLGSGIPLYLVATFGLPVKSEASAPQLSDDLGSSEACESGH